MNLVLLNDVCSVSINTMRNLPIPFPADPFDVRNSEDITCLLNKVFDDWLASAPAIGRRQIAELREESAAVYRDMWGSFVAFCSSDGLSKPEDGFRLNPLANLTVSDLQLFLSQKYQTTQTTQSTGINRPINSHFSVRYAWKMLHLIDRVLRFSRVSGWVTLPCPVFDSAGHSVAWTLLQEEPYRYANAADRNPLPEILSDSQVALLMARFEADQTLTLPAAQRVWKEVRDRTAAAMMLGAGLSPGDVRALRLDDVTIAGGSEAGVPWRLSVPADGTSPAHQTPIASWAGRQLAIWLTLRASLETPGNVLFVSTKSGKPWSHPSCHGSLVAVLDAAGIPGGTPFRLRHTFAWRQLNRGFDEEKVARWLGFVDTKPLEKYRGLLADPVQLS